MSYIDEILASVAPYAQGGDAVTGSGVIDQMAGLLDVLLGSQDTRRGQDISASTSRSNAATSAGASNYAADKSYAAAVLGYQANMEQIKRQYQVDVARLGVETADLNFRQRQAQASQRLNEKLYGLQHEAQRQSGEEFNFGQRQTEAQMKLGIMQMLADRKGPQDIVAYANLLNQLDAPTPDRSATIDPFSVLEGLVREFQFAPPAPETAAVGNIYQPHSVSMPSASGIDQQVATMIQQGYGGYQGGGGESATSIATGASGGGGGGYGFGGQGGNIAPTGGTTPSGSGEAYQRAFDQLMAQNPYMDPRLAAASAAVQTGTMQGQTPAVPGGQIDTAGQDLISSAIQVTGADRYNAAKDGQYLYGGSPYSYAAEGGMFPGMNVVEVGDPKPGAPSKPNREVVIGRDFAVIPKDQLRGKPQAKAATGGTYGGGGNSLTYNQYNDLSQVPAYQKLIGNLPSSQFTGFGAELSNPDIGIENAPSMWNLQTYRDFDPTSRDMLTSLYEQGLWTDPRDILERSRRAAPWGQAFGLAHYGGR